MNICLDCKALYTSRNRGIGNYAKSLYNALFQIDTNDRFFLVNWFPECDLSCFSIYPNVSEIKINQTFPLDNTFHKLIVDNAVDVYYFPDTFYGQWPLLNREWFLPAKMACTCHDVIPLIFPKEFFSEYSQYEKFKSYCENLQNFDLVFSNSENTKKDVLRFFKHVNIFNISMASEKKGGNDDVVSKSSRNLLKKWNIESPYVLYVGGLSYTKNVRNIVLAYEKVLEKSGLKTKPLVITCSFDGTIEENLIWYVKLKKLHKKIIFTNYVTDDELDCLYRNADWCVFPSLYEGFGLPVLESWLYKKPLMASNNSSVGEICGNAAILVDPFSVDSIAAGFAKLFCISDKERQRYIDLGQKQLEKFSGEKTAKVMLEKFHSVVGK